MQPPGGLHWLSLPQIVEQFVYPYRILNMTQEKLRLIVEDTMEKLDQVPVWMRQKVRLLHWNADKSKQQIKAMQIEMQKLLSVNDLEDTEDDAQILRLGETY